MKAKRSRILVALACGMIFGFGLSLSGMVDPARVIAFLDIASGNWDPSLAFVLGGALAVALAGMAVVRRMAAPVFDDHFHLPPKGGVDRRLLLGSALFGTGWGMAGFCPGPAIASLSMGIGPTVLFVASMLVGMAMHDRFVATEASGSRTS
jgi:uncharacterized protein